jgi:hypothetical protein
MKFLGLLDAAVSSPGGEARLSAFRGKLTSAGATVWKTAIN